MADGLSKRMKEQYEFRAASYLPRRTFTIIRLDGKAFHTYARHCVKPYDVGLSAAMMHTTWELVKQIQGCVLGYTQSDEISLLLTDFNTIHTDAWFDGNVQKITSVSAATATAEFNDYRWRQVKGEEIEENQHPRLGLFDSRVFTIPDRTEVHNYFVWRQKDAVRNSVACLAQSEFSPKQLHGKSQADMHDMLHTRDINWNDCFPVQKQGALVLKTGIEWCDIWTQSNQLYNLIPEYPRVLELIVND